MFDDILLPTDGSASMAAVTDHAIGLALLCDGTVHALHVTDENAYLAVPDDVRDRVRDTLAADGEAATKEVADQAIEVDVPVVREVRGGNPPATILGYAREHDVDVIVMGTHGRTGYERYLLGSVAEKVVRAATRPVLTVYVGEDEPADATSDRPAAESTD